MSIKSCVNAMGSCNASGACKKRACAKTCSVDAGREQELLEMFDKEEQFPVKAVRKCAHTAREQLKVATVYENKGFYVNAIEAVNKGLCFAPPNTENLGLLFAHRGQILREIKMYAEAIASFQLALDDSHLSPCKRQEIEEQMEELSRKMCQSASKCTNGSNKFHMSLSYPACPRNPAVISEIHVEENCTYGRHLVTDRNLEVGDVICIEKPFVKCIQPEQRYKRCTHCLKEVPHLLVPCAGCTNAMFCGDDCQQEALEAYHQFECGVSDDLMAMTQDISRLAFRTLLKAARMFNKDLSALKAFIADNKCRKVSPFDVDHSSQCKRDLLLAYYNGTCADSHLTDCIRRGNDQQAARLTFLLTQSCAFGKQLQCDELKVAVMELLYHFICVNTNNSYEIGSATMDHRTVPTCLGLFLCMSMASHSCAGNVVRLRVDGTNQMWVVTHAIPKGAQIFDNYGISFMNKPKCERQQRLRQHYGFECQCEACQFDFPMAKKLPEPCGVPHVGMSYINGSGPMSVAKLKAELRLLKEYYDKYDADSFPSKQMREAEIRLIHLFKVAAQDDTLETKYPEYTTHKPIDSLAKEVQQVPSVENQCNRGGCSL